MTTNKNKIIVSILWFIIGALCTLTFNLVRISNAQSNSGIATPQSTPIKEATQEFKVIADISPTQLEAEIKKLNKQGYVVRKDNLLVVGDHITIFLDNDYMEDDDSEEEDNSGVGDTK